jgi:hypothetical protein
LQVAETQAQAFQCITQGSLGGYLPTFYINWIFKNRQKPQTHKHRHFSQLPRGFYWVATYLHLILTGFSKTAKSRRHTSTGILVNYPDAFLGGYLPKFYINWISKTIKRGGTQAQAFRWISQRAPWVATYLHLILT